MERLQYNQRITQIKNSLLPLEERLSDALVVGADGPAKIGTVIDGLNPQLRAEMGRTVRDFRATGTFSKPLAGALKSKGDGIAFALFVIQGQKFIEAIRDFGKKPNQSLTDWLAAGESLIGMSAAGFAMVQGLSVTIFQAHIEQMESTAGKLNTMSRLGRWSGIAGFGAFLSGGIAAAFDLGKHSLQWGKALAEGDYKGLSATTLQITGDATLVGTNTWAAKHTGSVVKNIMKTPTELAGVGMGRSESQTVNHRSARQSDRIDRHGPAIGGRRSLQLFQLTICKNGWKAVSGVIRVSTARYRTNGTSSPKSCKNRRVS